jgi:FMN-dependent NADH-azoreductase
MGDLVDRFPAIKVERAAGAVAETKKKAEEEARRATEEAMNEFFAATKVTDDFIGQAAMEAEMRQCQIPAALKNHIKALAIAMGKKRI